MIGSATVTGNTGPGGVLTALPVPAVHELHFDFRHSMIKFVHGNPDKSLNVPLTGVTTITLTISGNDVAIVVS